MNIATILNHSSQFNRSFPAIDHQFNTSKDPDEAAPHPFPPSFFDVSSSLEVVRMSSEASALSFCLQICLPLCRFVFLYFCHCVSLSQFILSSFRFILVNWNLPGSLLSPFYCLFVLLSFGVTVFLSLCLSILVHHQFRSDPLSSLEVVLVLLEFRSTFPGVVEQKSVGWD